MDITRLVQAVHAHSASDAFRPDLTPQQWQALAPLLVRRELIAGNRLMRQGEVERSACLLERGNLQVFASGAAPGGQRIAILRPGALVGEPGLFAAVPRAAHVEAMTPCTVWQLEVGRLDALGECAPELALKLLRAAGAVMALRSRALRERGQPHG